MTISEWCPTCGANIVMVTRGIPSMGTCSNGHKTDRRDVLRRPPADPVAQELAALRAENARLRADAQAAVALALEKAAELVGDICRTDAHACRGTNPEMARDRDEYAEDLPVAIRSLADTDGLAMVEALRNPEQHGYVKVIDVEKLLCAKLGIPWTATGISIASMIDRLAADLAAAQAQIEALRGALKQIEEQDDVGDMMYYALGPFAKIARAALAALPAKEG
jgi:hypothetical protein